jgi:hypothetical protein
MSEVQPEVAEEVVDVQPEPVVDREAEMKAVVDRVVKERDDQWIAYNAQSQPEPVKAEEPAADVGQDIKALYTDDEQGRLTQKTFDEHMMLKFKEMGIDPGKGVTLEDVERIADQRAQNVREQIRSGLTITQEVTNLVQSGKISPEDSRVVQHAYSQACDTPQMRAAAQNPANAPWILKGVVYDLWKAGKITTDPKPKRNENPLTPGGNGAPPAQTEVTDPSTSPFQSVRNMDKDKLDLARNLSKANYGAANRSS